MKKRIFSWFMAVAMVMSLIPGAAFATDTTTVPSDGDSVAQDTVTEVATYEELVVALAASNANIKMLNDINGTASENSGYGKAGIVLEAGDVLDGSGYKLTISDANGTWDCAVAMKGGEVKNLTIAGAFRGAFMPGANGDVVIDNCKFEGVVYTFNSDAGSKDYEVTIKNTALNGWTSFSNVHKAVTFENCTFGEGSGYAFCRPYQETTFTGCVFNDGFEFDATKANDNGLTFNNCTYASQALSDEHGYDMFYNGGKVKVDDVSVNYSNVAKIVGGDSYATLPAAITAAKPGDTITLLKDVTTTSSITVTNALTINGNGKKLTVTGGAYGIDVKAGVNLVINELTLESTGYGINLRGASDNAKVEITDSYIKGYGALNIWGTNVTVNVDDSTLHGHNHIVDASGTNNFYVIVLNADYNTGNIADDTVVNVNGGKIITSSGDGCNIMGVGRIDSASGEIKISNTTVIENNGGGSADIIYSVAKNGDLVSPSLEVAIKDAKNGDTIYLLKNVTENVAVSKNITLDLNGKALTGTITLATAESTLTADEGLTVVSGVTGYNVAYSEDAYVLVESGLTGVTLDKTTLSLNPGNTAALIATVAPDNANDKTVTWSSNNTAVATVSNGTVTAVAAGSATITVTTNDGGFTATCTVTVTNPPVYDDDDDYTPAPSNPTVDKETTKNEDGSTTVTETKKDGTTVETTTNTDGSSVTTETKTEVKETASSTTTTTTTETVTKDADGNKETVKTEEKVVETATSTTTTTTTETKTDTKTETVEVVEKVEIDEDGNETVTTTSTTETKLDNGSTGTTTVAADGTVTAEAKVTTTAVTEASKDEAPVTLPIASVPVSNTTETAATVDVSVPASAGQVTVEIPVENVTPGTVVVLVDEDGNETVVNTTGTTENGVVVNVEGNVTVKVVDNSKDFEDVTSDDWYSDAADFASSRELMNGMDEDTFGHNLPTNRAMVAQILHNMEGKEDHNYEGSFNDVDEDDWHADAIYWAADNDIISGTGNGNFDPMAPVTREQLAVMLWKYAGSEDSDHYIGHFNDDHEISSWAETAMRWAVENGLMSGKGNGQLDPQGEATRAEVASVLMNFYKNVKY